VRGATRVARLEETPPNLVRRVDAIHRGSFAGGKWAPNAPTPLCPAAGERSAETARGVTHPTRISTLAHGVIEGVEAPSRSPRTWRAFHLSPWSRLSQRRPSPRPTINVGSAARGLTGHEQLSFCALGECLGAHHYEQLVGRTQRPTSIGASALSAQPFAVQELCSGGPGHPGEVGLRGASLARNLQGVQFEKSCDCCRRGCRSRCGG
jgi:hypothetical protein